MFKVGDRVMLKGPEYVSELWETSNDFYFKGSIFSYGTIYIVERVSGVTISLVGYGCHTADRFELVKEEQPMFKAEESQ